MDPYRCFVGLDQPATYVIKVQGRLDRVLSDWFLAGLTYVYEPGSPEEGRSGVTTIQGRLADQPALHGLLNYIRDLGLTLLFVACLDAHQGSEDTGPVSI